MFKNDFNFLGNKHQGEGLLPWVIAVMLFLCSLSLILGIALGRGLDNWSSGLAARLSVQIVSADKLTRDRQTDNAIRLLRATPGIKQVEVMPESDVLELIKPWLGEIPAEAGLPIPTLINVELDEPGAVNTKALAERLRATASTARLDDHQVWISRILDLASMLQFLLMGIGTLVILCTIAIVIFGCRAGLASHRKNIEVMHLLGAEDKLISRTFEYRYMVHGIIGGIGGVIIAGLSLYGLASLSERMGQGLLLALMPTADDYYALMVLPILTSIITMVTAGITVRAALKDMM